MSLLSAHVQSRAAPEVAGVDPGAVRQQVLNDEVLVRGGGQLEGRLRARGEPIRGHHFVTLTDRQRVGQSHLSVVLLQVQAAAGGHPGGEREGQSATALRHGDVKEPGREGRKK